MTSQETDTLPDAVDMKVYSQKCDITLGSFPFTANGKTYTVRLEMEQTRVFCCIGA